MKSLDGASIDVLIIGGGINGAGIARDLGLRRQTGLSLEAALVEMRHFGSGTSGRNSQLIHGGLRYLKYLKFGLVKESLRERATLRQLAPHLVEPLAFLLPTYSRVDKMKFLMGLSMYDRLAGDSNIAKHREVSRAEMLELEPGLAPPGLAGGALFYDCLVHSSRFVLENLFDAVASGIHAANYARAEPIERNSDGSWRVRIEDTLAGKHIQLQTRKIVDATGAWSKPGDRKPRLVRGSHLVLPRITHEDHAIAFFDAQGRILFLIPWGSRNHLTLVGTTDVDHEGPADDPRISQDEVDYLINIVQRLYPTAPNLKPIAAFSSLRALADEGSDSPTSASREHRIFNTNDNILRIQGGKYTTYRAMAEEAVDVLSRELAPWLSIQHRTAHEPLSGNSEKALARLRNTAGELAAQYHLSKADTERLIREYGVHVSDLLAMIPAEDYGPVSRVQHGCMAYAVHHEMAMRLSDYLFVSSYEGYDREWNSEGLEPFAELMGHWMEWDRARQANEILHCLRQTALPGTWR